MTLSTPVRLLLGIAGFAVGTAWLGWWAVPLISMVWVLGRPAARSRPAGVGLAAALAWAALLGWQAARAPGPMATLAERVAGPFGLPGPAMLALPPLYAGLLAWGAATLAAGLAAPLRPAGR